MNAQTFQLQHPKQTYTPSKSEYVRLASKGTLIPVFREVIADTITPVSALLSLGEGSHRFILESVEGGNRLGRYSFVGTETSSVFKSYGDTIHIGRRTSLNTSETQGMEWTVERSKNPLDRLRSLLQEYRPAASFGLPRFYGGAVGYFGYDLVRSIYDLPDTQNDVLGLPDTYLIMNDVVLIFDHVQGTLQIVCNSIPGSDPERAYDEAVSLIEKTFAMLKEKGQPHPLELPGEHRDTRLELTSNFSREQFEDAVRRCQQYINNGDVEQVVLSQRFDVPVDIPPMTLYRVLRTVNPSPYMYYLQLDDTAIVGSSPEVMVRAEDGVASVRPIAGTRPRGQTDEEDRRLADELLHDEKEVAEHEMLVRLGEDDLKRVCDEQSIRVNDSMQIERYSHVMHIVSNVVGQLKAGKDAIDLLQAAFPAGTVSGAPRQRAHEIIEEIERDRRGPYSGAIGYIGYSGNMDTCITIRTAIMKDSVAHVQVGAGIVSASVPESEYEETINKAKAMLEAIGIAKNAFSEG